MPERGINIYQINRDVVAISYYSYVDNIIKDVNIISLVWVTSHLFNPYILVPPLKTLLNLIIDSNIILSNEFVEHIVKNIKENKGILQTTIESVELKSNPLPPNFDNMIVKFFN